MPTEGDRRFSVAIEWTGDYKAYRDNPALSPGQAWVARFCDGWIGSAPFEKQARRLADQHDDVRMGRA